MLGAIHQIGELCQSPFNAGFLTHLYLIRTDDLAYVHGPNGVSIFQHDRPVGIRPNAPITQLLIKPKTATFTEVSNETVDGVAFTSNLTVPMKGTAQSITNWVHQNTKGRFVILTRDTLGNCYLIGGYDNGARLTWSRQVTQQSIHALSLSITNWHPIQFIPTIDLDELFQHREFDYSFDLSFS